MYKNTDATHSKNWRVLNQRADGVHIEQVAALKTFLDQGCFINEVKKIYIYLYLLILYFCMIYCKMRGK